MVHDNKSGTQPSASALSRRSFLNYSGAVLAGASLLVACKNDDDPMPPVTGEINLGTGDTGILNYAYALEQLEAAFYTMVLKSAFSGMTAAEMELLADIRDHEIAHREFFKNALGSKAISDLTFDFGSIDFTKRDSVLGTAKVFEDLGVSAYNGAGKLLTTPDYLVLAGKIVSVEARHAAFIRDLISNGSFADNTVVDANGLDKSRTPQEVLSMAAGFVKNNINISGLPK
jgi:hypothetical protein